jgi:ferritin-like protein
MLKVALADEWLAAYQYWVCKNLVRGEGRSDVMPEFEQHYKDEL